MVLKIYSPDLICENLAFSLYFGDSTRVGGISAIMSNTLAMRWTGLMQRLMVYQFIFAIYVCSHYFIRPFCVCNIAFNSAIGVSKL